MQTINGIVKINLKQNKPAYWVTGALILLAVAQMIVMGAIGLGAGSNSLALGSYLVLLPLLTAILIPARNFTKLMNLGSKRMDFFKSCIATYLPMVLFVSLFCVLTTYAPEKILGIFNLASVFGFMRSGAVVAFFQMSAFLLLFSCVLHTLTLAQSHWYGVVADILIVAIISVFTPIAPLRASLVWFFRLIIFHEYALVQILSCLVLSAVVYAASLIPIKNKC